MAAPRSYRRQGVVLQSRPLGEADLLVTLFASESGKVKAVARGARNPTSKLVGHLEPLTRVDVSLAKGRDLDYIGQAQVLEAFLPLKASLAGVTQGLYLAELVTWYAVEDVANASLYDLLLDALRLLPECNSPEVVLRCFELQLLKSSGFMPELYRCVNCRTSLVPENHRFSPEAGGALCNQCTPAGLLVRPLSLEALKVLRFLAGATLVDADRLKLEGPLAEEVSRLLSVLMSYWPDHEIRSRRFMDHVRVLAEASPSPAASELVSGSGA